MPTAEEFKLELQRMMLEAAKEGKDFVNVNAGELHHRVGGYPGANHRMPNCCQVMKQAFTPEYGDTVLEEPPKGQGASLTIRYRVPRPEAS